MTNDIEHTLPWWYRTYASLLITSDAVDPDSITTTLGLDPDWVSRKGSKARLGATTVSHVWAITTRDVLESRDIRDHVNDLLDLVAEYEEEFLEVKKMGCLLELSVFWSSVSGTGGPFFDSSFMERAASFGIDVELDFWLSPCGVYPPQEP